MSDTNKQKSGGKKSKVAESFRKKGFQIFGLGAQDFIRFFFGGNASLAIIILILICVFLAREGIMFFPDHHKGLKSYRLAGQELVDYVGEEIDAHTSLYSAANVAYYAEVNRTSQEEDTILRAYRSVLANVENMTKKTWGRLEAWQEEKEDLEDELEDLLEDKGKLTEAAAAPAAANDANADQAADTKESEDSAAKLAEVNKEIAAVEARMKELDAEIELLSEKLKKEVNVAIASDEAWDLGVGADQPPADSIDEIKEAVLFEAHPDADEEHAFIVEVKERSKEKKAKAAEELTGFKDTVKGIQAAVRPIRSYHSDLKKIAVENKREIEKFSTAPERRKALLEGAENTEDPEDKQEMLDRANAVDIIEPEYDKINAPIYERVPEHEKLAADLKAETDKLYAALPEVSELETKSARESFGRAEVYNERFQNRVEENTEKVKEWRHDKNLSIFESATAFIFGKNWITNSSWHDFYGLLPLLSGSLLISIIALVVAVPFAVAAAVYVNQVAPYGEQNFVKPAIEFIEAIPSVVLGFFGILVFGETLRNVSQVEWLSWVPGFPMAERLTILNAGLLLAFMAIPTIFTLAEDALNNVPGALTENSLAMGASKLQTVFRVIVPTALSGIIAAVLLGFGRIVGETMVVLLVAGNKIKIPDFTEGLGVVAQPAHTMTGIIAQELGEVDEGSLHWRALFIVGMVLFCISLAVNFAAQKVLKKFQKI